MSYTQQVLKSNNLSNILKTFPPPILISKWYDLFNLVTDSIRHVRQLDFEAHELFNVCLANSLAMTCTFTSICLVITKQYININLSKDKRQYHNSNPANSVSTKYLRTNWAIFARQRVTLHNRAKKSNANCRIMTMKRGVVLKRILIFLWLPFHRSSYLLTLGYLRTGKGHVLDQKEIPELRLSTRDGV